MIPQTPIFVTYTGDGTTTVFHFDKRIYLAADLQVWTYTPGTDTVPQLMASGFTVAVDNDFNGAAATIAVAPAAGVKVGLIRRMDLTQDIDISNTNYVPPSLVEQQMDRQVMMAQEAALFSTLGLETDPFEFTKTARANRFQAFDGNGDQTIGPLPDALSAAAAAASAADAAASAASIHLPVPVVANTMLVAKPDATGYLAETAAQVRSFLNNDLVTPGMSGAIGDGVSNDDAATHTAATAAGLGGTVHLPQGKRFKISNLDFGGGSTGFDGAGSVGTTDTNGFWRRNSYADRPGLRSVYFPEYQSTLNRTILGSLASQSSSLSTVVGHLRGDSQTHGGFGEYVKLEVALSTALTDMGLPNNNIVNLAISGTRWSQLLDGSASQLPSSFVGVNFTMLGFGANDLDYYDFPTMVANADAAIAWIRGKPGGAWGTHTIYLRVPNAMTYGAAVFGNGLSRNEELSELFLQAYLHLGRKYQCVVWDAYGNFRDARTGVNYTFDNAFSDGRAIHPINDANEVLAAQFIREAFPRAQFARVSTNKFENHGAVSSTLLASIAPNQFHGQQWYRATVANGFPFEGAVMVNTNVDQPAIQTLVGYAIAGTSEHAFRTANIGANTWNPWVYLTETNGVYTPVVTSATGVITTVGAVSGRYKKKQDLCYFSATAAITTNGTGAGALRVTLPFTAGANLCHIHGREAATSGAVLTGEIAVAGTYATVLTYNNAYPAANGSVIQIDGWYWLP